MKTPEPTTDPDRDVALECLWCQPDAVSARHHGSPGGWYDAVALVRTCTEPEMIAAVPAARRGDRLLCMAGPLARACPRFGETPGLEGRP